MRPALALLVVLTAPVLAAFSITMSMTAGSQPGDFGLDCAFDPPVLLPGDGCGVNISLENRMKDEVLVWAVGIRFDWMAAHWHYYDECATKPVVLDPGRTGAFRPVFEVPADAAAADHSYHVCVEYQLNRSGALKNDTWMSDTRQGLQVTDFGISVEPAEVSLPAGDGAVLNLSVLAKNGFNDSVELAVAAPFPEQGTFRCELSPASLPSPDRQAKVLIATNRSCPDRRYALVLEGRCRGLWRATTLNLTVLPPPDFLLNVTPSKGRLSAGGNRSFLVTVSGHRNLTDDISLAAAHLPGGCSARFFPGSLSVGGSARLEIRAGPDAPACAGKELVVQGSTARWVATGTVTLSVEPRPATTGNLLLLALIILLAVVLAVWAMVRRRRRGRAKERAQ